MTRIEAHQYKLQLIKSSFLSFQNYAFIPEGKKWLANTSIQIEYYFLFYRRWKEQKHCSTCYAQKDSFLPGISSPAIHSIK